MELLRFLHVICDDICPSPNKRFTYLLTMLLYPLVVGADYAVRRRRYCDHFVMTVWVCMFVGGCLDVWGGCVLR